MPLTCPQTSSGVLDRGGAHLYGGTSGTLRTAWRGDREVMMGSSETVRAEVVDVVDPGPAHTSARVILDLRNAGGAHTPEAVSATEAATRAVSVEQAATTGDTAAGHERSRGSLRGKIAVVTGGSTGPGRSVALQLASEGARVCVVGGSVAELRTTVAMAGSDAAMVFLQCDVGSTAEIESVVDFIHRFDRPVDLVIHAEQVRVAGTFAQGAVSDLDEQYLVNVRAPYLLTQQLLGRLREAGGRVVFLDAAGGDGYGQHRLISGSVRAMADELRREAGDTISVTTVTSAPEVADDDLARVIVDAASSPAHLEVGEIRLRARVSGHDLVPG